MVYQIARKQALIGVCFFGLQRLGADSNDGFYRIGLDEAQYFTWMGMAASIQRKNGVVNQRCIELQEKLLGMGLRSCIVKGQSAAALYPDGLRLSRQSGDIDSWVDAPRLDLIAIIQKTTPTTNIREHHMDCRLFDDVEVELHYWPAVIRHFLKNRRLQKWFNGKRSEVFENRVEVMGHALCSPTPEFHAVQMMAHMYHHLFDSGIGLRQVMDYFFVLQALPEESVRVELNSSIKYIGMGRFASAMMYVLHETMGLTREKMICEPDEKDGRFLLRDIMRGGNFGHYDDRKNLREGGYINSFFGGIVRNFRYLRFNPFDWFWSPLWRLWYFGWRKLNGWK